MKKTKIIVCMALSLLMMFACAIPAFAADETKYGQNPYTISGEKVIDGENAPSTEFEFTLTPGKAYSSVTSGLNQTTGVIESAYSGEFANPLTGPIQATVTDEGKFSFDAITFTKPGYYFYTVSETKGGVDTEDGTWANSKATYTVLLQAMYDDDGKLIVAPTVWRETTHTGEEDGLKYDHGKDEDKILTAGDIIILFKNVYSETVIEPTDFIVSKTVTGNMGDRTKFFTFTLSSITSKNTTHDFKIMDNNGTPDDLTDDVQVTKIDNVNVATTIKAGDTFKLAHNMYAIISDLNVGDRVIVKETPVAPYQTSAIQNDGEVKDLEIENTATVTIGEGDNSVAYTNNYEAPPVVGSMMAAIPFVLLVTLAAGGVAMLIIKKRKAIAE